MSSISGVASGSNPFENSLLKRISYATSSGQLSQTDGSAISSAIGDIASQLQSSTSAKGAPSTQSANPGQFRKKVNDLIDGEVSSGKLTDAQASELKGLLEPGKGGPGNGNGPDGPGGPGGPGGPSGAGHHHHHVKSGSDTTDQANDDDGDDQTSTTASTSTAASTLAAALQAADPSQSSSSSSDPLQAFLKTLGDAQNALSNATYGQQATSNSATTSSIGLVNQFV